MGIYTSHVELSIIEGVLGEISVKDVLIALASLAVTVS